MPQLLFWLSPSDAKGQLLTYVLPKSCDADGPCRQAKCTHLIKCPDGPQRYYPAPVAFLAAASKVPDLAEVLRSTAEVAGHETKARAFRVFLNRDYSDVFEGAFSREREEEKRIQCQLIQCFFGNRFHPVSITPLCVTPAVSSLAQAAYEERALPSGELDPARLAVLADALE